MLLFELCVAAAALTAAVGTGHLMKVERVDVRSY